jgi:tripartite ATP-independent transporter DctM subunit
MGGIYTGLFTPSEASAVGAFIAILLAFMKRATKTALRQAFSESAKTSAMIFMLLVGAMVFAQFIAISGVGADIAKALSEFPAAKVLVLILILTLYIPMGMFLDGMSVMLITMPVIFPTVLKLGYDPIWFGVIITKMIEIGLITPPVGFNIFIIKGVTPDVPLETIFKGAAFFLILDLITVGLLIAFPQIVIWLPYRVM